MEWMLSDDHNAICVGRPTPQREATQQMTTILVTVHNTDNKFSRSWLPTWNKLMLCLETMYGHSATDRNVGCTVRLELLSHCRVSYPKRGKCREVKVQFLGSLAGGHIPCFKRYKKVVSTDLITIGRNALHPSFGWGKVGKRTAKISE